MPKRKTIKLGFICLACDHLFKQRVPALYIDLHSFNQVDIEAEAPDRSPYTVPQPVVCPNCEAVDQFDLTGGSNLRVLLALLLHRYLPFLAPSRIRPDPTVPPQAR